MAKTNVQLMQAWIDGTASPDESAAILFPPPIAKTIPFRVTAIEPGMCVMEMATDPDSQANPMGTIHGGVLCTIADAAVGVAHWAGLDEGESFTSVDFRINFFRPVWRDTLRVTARVINGGRTVSYYTCDVVRGDGKLVAQATSTLMTLRGDAASGR
ncbi:MAG: PaaI family thioesterase [Acidobacteriota bacterium]